MPHDLAVQRYATVGRQLSGVRLHPLDSPLAASPWPRAEPGRFLGRFDAPALLEELELHGVLDGLRARGFERIELELDDGRCAGRSVVRLWRAGARGQPAGLLMELVMWREHLEVAPSLAPAPLGGHAPQPVVTCEWLRLQDPERPFDAQRPRLPGQALVGLGVGDQVLAAMIGWASRLDACALLTLPDHFHSAVIFERAFRAIDPELEGLLAAAKRDLDVARRGLATVSWCFEWGLVGLERRDGQRVGRPWLWPSEPEVVALSGPLRQWMASEAYAARRRAACEDHRFVLDEAAARRRWPTVTVTGRGGPDS